MKNIPQLFKFKKTTIVFYPFITGKGFQDIRKVFSQTKAEDKELIDYYKPKVDQRHNRWNRILDIQKAVNDRLIYKTDIDNYGKYEYWARPIEIHNQREDDCDGSAVLMCYVLRLLGLTDYECFVAVGDVYRPNGQKGELHAYCIAYNENNGRFMPLEGSWYADTSRTEAFANEPIWEQNDRYAKPEWITNDITSMSSSMIPFRFTR